jgi:GMP synthase (glutamine-hydrolysing)
MFFKILLKYQSMKTIILRHTISTPPGTSVDWLEKRDLPFEVLMVKDIQKWPSLESFGDLIICGGGMNVDQEDKYPWLRTEKEFIRQCIKAGKKIVGLCLGSQLLAEVLGARVYKHTDWESGWHDVRLADQSTLKVFEWHAYTFDLPAGAELLATSSQCRHQAYQVGTQILAFQFHPEASREWILARAGDPEAPTRGFVQSKDEILQGLELYHSNLEAWFFKQLDQHFLGIKS